MANGDGLRRTYEMHGNPPAAMRWEDYRARVTAEWQALLNSEEGCNERTIHRFLAKHPSLIPGAGSGHGSFPLALISEPPLIGIGQKIPDFVWLANDSLNFSPVFIEIESPCKRWFTNGEVPAHKFTQAWNQLGQWQAWFNRAENQLNFFEQFQIPDRLRRHRNFRPRFVLIYGRRREFDERPELVRLRAQFERDDKQVMTFDRLEASAERDVYISATKTQNGYKALAVPAVFRLSPMIVEDLMMIREIPEAVRQNDWISRERQDFLVERLGYWTNWCRTGQRGIINTGDWE